MAFLIGVAVVVRYLLLLQLGDPVTDKTAVTPYTCSEIFRKLPNGKIMVPNQKFRFLNALNFYVLLVYCML